MQHDANLFAQGDQVYLAYIVPIDQYCTLADVVEARDQVYQAGLARTGWADQGNDLVGLYGQTDITQRSGVLTRILEGHLAELHLARQPWQLHRLLGRLDLWYGIEYLESALCSRYCFSGGIDHPGELLGWTREHQQITVEGYQFSDGQLAVHYHLSAKPQDEQRTCSHQELRGRHDLCPF